MLPSTLRNETVTDGTRTPSRTRVTTTRLSDVGDVAGDCCSLTFTSGLRLKREAREDSGKAPPGVERQIVRRIAITGYLNTLCCEHVADDFGVSTALASVHVAF